MEFLVGLNTQVEAYSLYGFPMTDFLFFNEDDHSLTLTMISIRIFKLLGRPIASVFFVVCVIKQAS